MNSFLRRMGVPADWEINDVFGLEEELLSMLPQPVLALLLLFPISEKASGTYLSNLQQWRTQDLLEGAGSLSFEIICFWQFLIEYSHYRKLPGSGSNIFFDSVQMQLRFKSFANLKFKETFKFLYRSTKEAFCTNTLCL